MQHEQDLAAKAHGHIDVIPETPMLLGSGGVHEEAGARSGKPGTWAHRCESWSYL